MNKTLLILSDDKILKQKYTKALLQNGFKVADASDLIDGMLIAKKHTIDAILLDEDLENNDIFQNYSKIRKYSQAPIIFLVEKPTDDIPTKGNGNGYNTCFEKSDNPTELASYIQIIVGQAELKEKAKAPVKKVSGEVETSLENEPVLSIVTNLEQQVTKIKSLMSALHQIQKTIAEAEVIIHERQEAMDTVVHKLNEVKKHINDITGNSER
jgi:DNA-binding response OmpR family regulator